MIEVHQWKCVICRKAIIDEFEIDHMLPKELGLPGREAELAALLNQLERSGFDIHGLGNLGPVHRTCNNQKGVTVYPVTILHERLTFIGSLVPEVERFVTEAKRSRAFEKAMLVIAAAIDAGETSSAAVGAKLAEAIQTAVPVTVDYAVAWTPMALRQVRDTDQSMEWMETALLSAAQRGEMKFQRNPSLPNAWILRFMLNREPWRAFARFDNGLLLITKVAAKKSRLNSSR